MAHKDKGHKRNQYCNDEKRYMSHLHIFCVTFLHDYGQDIVPFDSRPTPLLEDNANERLHTCAHMHLHTCAIF